jgi:carbon-monoxide dehydrogenase medium subunit
VRNRGTIGGSLAHADPGADYPTVVLALDATIVARGPKGDKKIPAGRFFTGLFTTALKSGEILTAVLVPVQGKNTGGAYRKHRHPASSYAVIGVAAVVEIEGGKCARVSIAVGGATPNPVRCPAAESALWGD